MTVERQENVIQEPTEEQLKQTLDRQIKEFGAADERIKTMKKAFSPEGLSKSEKDLCDEDQLRIRKEAIAHWMQEKGEGAEQPKRTLH